MSLFRTAWILGARAVQGGGKRVHVVSGQLEVPELPA